MIATNRRILYGVVAIIAIFIMGAVIGGVWDDNDTAGAITVTLWAISVIGMALLLLSFAVSSVRRRRTA